MKKINEKFYNLSDEKQQQIINGAVTRFGKYGYKKASIEEIAKDAGISKSLVFHYFGSKKELFVFVYKYGIQLMRKKLVDCHLENETDFIEIMKKSIILKAEVIAEYPLMSEFLVHAYYESDEDIQKELNTINSTLISNAFPTYLRNIDVSKFKDNITLETAMKMVTWLSDGYMNSKKNMPQDVPAQVKEFFMYLDLLKELFYK